MSAPIDAGDPAFPVHPEMAGILGCVSSQSDCGMTLRDYLAAKAMPYFIPMSHEELQDATGEYEGHDTLRLVAIAAYFVADAMLKVREA